MFEPVKISPSILSADVLAMGTEIDAITEAGADWIHVDVMDGHFVPNLTFGVPLVNALKSHATLPLDVHLMISNPLEQLEWFIKAQPDYLTIHAEALPDTQALVQAATMIHEGGCKAGVSLKPDTPTSILTETIELWDMVLVMSVYPGFSGQGYIEGSDMRVAEVAAMAREAGCSPLIQVDGGINDTTAALVAASGADVLVAGNAVFKAPSYAQAIASIRSAATQVQARG